MYQFWLETAAKAATEIARNVSVNAIQQLPTHSSFQIQYKAICSMLKIDKVIVVNRKTAVSTSEMPDFQSTYVNSEQEIQTSSALPEFVLQTIRQYAGHRLGIMWHETDLTALQSLLVQSPQHIMAVFVRGVGRDEIEKAFRGFNPPPEFSVWTVKCFLPKQTFSPSYYLLCRALPVG